MTNEMSTPFFNTAKVVGTITSAAILAAGGVAAISPEANAMPSTDAVVIEQQSSEAAAFANGIAVVQGDFSFTQDAVASSESITSVFKKAAATLCASLPEYQVAAVSSTIRVVTGGDGFTATLTDMESEQGTTHTILGCACATNAPGGGAVTNAEVSGVSLESIVQAALVQ